MEYESIINKYREKFHDKKTLLFIDFIETLFEWVEKLHELKRIPRGKQSQVDNIFPKQIFSELDLLPEGEISEQDYIKLKQLLLGETTKLVHTIISICDIRLSDFDVLQFNLYQIFGKEEIASMIEWARLHLQEELERKKREGVEEKVRKKKEGEEYLNYIRSLSEEDLRKRAISLLFDFTPSARTLKERGDTVISNKNKILNHRATFYKFEEKLIDATSNARAQSELNVYKRMGEVKRDMDVAAGKFKEKAIEFASSEGPKKRIGEARERIEGQSKELGDKMSEVGRKWEETFGLEVSHSQEVLSKRKEQLTKNIILKGKTWEQDFLIDVASARDRISTQSRKLTFSVSEKGKEWQSGFKKDIGGAQKKIHFGQEHLFKERVEKRGDILTHGEGEFEKASEMVSGHKTQFSDDIDIARKKFEGKEELISGKREEMGEAREDFIEKRDIAAESFLSRASEVETEMYGTIYHEKRRFVTQRDDAQQRFLKRGAEIQGTATNYVNLKKGNFINQRTDAQQKFIGARGMMQEQGTLSTDGKFMKSIDAKGKISQANNLMTEEGRKKNSLMQQKMKHQRDLFQYDVRFAQHRIKQNALQFSENVMDKQEEFVSQGKQLVKRHKARQKAHLIQNLLRAIRSSH